MFYIVQVLCVYSFHFLLYHHGKTELEFIYGILEEGRSCKTGFLQDMRIVM